MKDVKIAFRKPIFPVSEALQQYLEKYNRTTKIKFLYEDLLRFSDNVRILDKDGKDTLWLGVLYSEYEFKEIEANLNKIYTLLHSDGDIATLPYLKVDTIDFCTFGNSKPFRIRVRNILNDNYTYFILNRQMLPEYSGWNLKICFSPTE